MFLQVPDFVCIHSTGLPCTMYCKYEGDCEYEIKNKMRKEEYDEADDE